MASHSGVKLSQTSLMLVFGLLALASLGVKAQTPQSPNLVSNQKLTDYLNTQVLPTQCISTGFENALKDIGYLASLSYVIRTNTIPVGDASKASLDQFVIDALTAAVQTPNQVAAKVLPADNWNDSAVIKNTQHFVYAISDGTNISYYELQFDLNNESALADKASYIGAMAFLACDNTRQWIQHYFAAAPSTRLQ